MQALANVPCMLLLFSTLWSWEHMLLFFSTFKSSTLVNCLNQLCNYNTENLQKPLMEISQNSILSLTLNILHLIEWHIINLYTLSTIHTSKTTSFIQNVSFLKLSYTSWVSFFEIIQWIRRDILSNTQEISDDSLLVTSSWKCKSCFSCLLLKLSFPFNWMESTKDYQSPHEAFEVDCLYTKQVLSLQHGCRLSHIHEPISFKNTPNHKHLELKRTHTCGPISIL